MSKNTRWALAIVGVVVIIVAAVVIGTGKDDTSATPTTAATDRPATDTQHDESGMATGATGGEGHEHGHANPGENSGGAAPGEGTGGANPEAETGGAKAQTGVVSPILTPERPRTVKAKKGDFVVIRARAEKPATLHVHGYDKTLELVANKTGQIKLRATIDGEFAIELHYAGSEAEVGTLRVSP